MELKLEDFRREYTRGGLERDQLAQDPLDQFDRWMQQTIKSGMPDPNAMTIATVDATGQPSQRIVLLKHLDEKGFVFYTNLNSQKAQDLKQNPKISLHFPWYFLERQVKVCGVAERLPVAEVMKYFVSRPRDSQLGAWASHQSKPISSRALLLQQFEAMKNKFFETSSYMGYRYGTKLKDIHDYCDAIRGGEDYILTNGENWYTKEGKQLY